MKNYSILLLTALLIYACQPSQNSNDQGDDSFAKYGQKFKGKIAKSYQDSEEWWPSSPKPKEGTPNVLLILLDDTGFGHLGSFGGLTETPNIDKLASKWAQV